MKDILQVVQWSFFLYLLIQVTYLLFFSLAGKLAAKKSLLPAKKLRCIRVFIPGYKEDAVILDTAKAALAHDYPADKFEVCVIADSFSEATLQALRQLAVNVIEVAFEKSTKGKALHKAIAKTVCNAVDIAVVLDADNHMAPGFLHAVNNAFENGYDVVQGHRTSKNFQTAFAYLDSCIEEVNNHIFRRGHTAVGLPSALIGSGMAFQWGLFVRLFENIGDTAGEDKELEFRILKERKSILFLDGAFVYDEKVAKAAVFARQRSRWVAMQVEFFQKYFLEGVKQLLRGNVAFFDKVFQMFLLPRVMLMGLIFIGMAASAFVSMGWSIAFASLLAAWGFALLLGIPTRWYNRRFAEALVQIPAGFFGMLKAMLHIQKARHQFIHTPHGETVSK